MRGKWQADGARDSSPTECDRRSKLVLLLLSSQECAQLWWEVAVAGYPSIGLWSRRGLSMVPNQPAT